MYKEAYDALSEANSMVQNNPIVIFVSLCYSNLSDKF